MTKILFLMYRLIARFALLLLPLSVSIVTFGQSDMQLAEKQGVDAKEYDRSSLTVLMIDKSGQFASDLRIAMSRLSVPDKFDDNMLERRVLGAVSSAEGIGHSLVSSKVSNDILAKWFSRQPDGSFSMTLVHERGLYNATDADVIEASASKLGLDKLRDAGEFLVSHSYVLVLDFGRVRTMEQVYDEIDKNRKASAKAFNTKYHPVARNKNGYEANVTGYLYRLDSVSSIMDDFYANMWIYNDDPAGERDRKRQLFDDSRFGFSYVASASVVIEASQYNGTMGQMSKQQLFDLLMRKSVDAVVNAYESEVDELKVVTALYDTHPLRAKIGMKEGLAVEDRYFVYEYRMNDQNQVYASRRGVVRAKSVADNRHVAQGQSADAGDNTSRFYQIAGHKLEPGMFIEQNNDMGCGFSCGYVAGAQSGIFANVEVLSGSSLGISQFKTFIGGHVDFGKYDLNECGEWHYDSDLDDASMFLMGAELGISKGFFLTRNVAVAGLAGFAMEWGDFADSDLSKDYFENGMVECVMLFAGAQMAINLRYDIQLVGGINYYSEVGNASLTKKNEDGDKELGVRYSEIFEGRLGSSINLGLRIQF